MEENRAILEGLSPWEQIQSSKLQEITQSKQWSMVVFTDYTPQNDLSVFPPANHENLQISAQQNQREQNSPSKSRPTAAIRPDLSKISSLSNQKFTSWMDAAIRILRAKINRFPYFSCGAKGVFWSFYPVAGVATVVLAWLWLAQARRRLNHGETVDHLKNIIKEKDEKIIQLLHQIAQMNEVLVANRTTPETVIELIRQFFKSCSTKLLSL